MSPLIDTPPQPSQLTALSPARALRQARVRPIRVRNYSLHNALQRPARILDGSSAIRRLTDSQHMAYFLQKVLT